MKIEERETIDDILTRTEKTWSEPISTSKCENHESKVKSDPEPPPSDFSDDPSSSSDSRSKRKKIIRKIIRKKRRKHQKYESDPSSIDDSDDSDSSEEGHYRRRRHTHTEHRKKYLIILYSNLTAKLLTTVFKSQMIQFKLDEDPLQRLIYFLTFIDSLNMVFSQYRETYEVLREYPKNGGGKYKRFFQKWPLETFCMPIVVYISKY